MISRCPSCAAEVDDEAARCPSCHWDFELRKRVPPEGEEAQAEKPKEKPAAKTPPSPEPELPAGASKIPESKPKREEEPAPKDVPSPEPELPASAGKVPEAKPKREDKPAPHRDEPKAGGSGLKQFGKLEKFEKPEAPAKEEPAKKEGFALPSARGDKKEEYPGPPATEVRFSPARAEKEKEKEKDREKDRSAKDKQDAAERFKKRGKTDPKGKALTKPPAAPKFAFDAKLAAGIVVVLVVTAVGVFLLLRPDQAAPKRAQTLPKETPAPKSGAEKLLTQVDSIVNGPQPDRDIRHIQRAPAEPVSAPAEPQKPAPVAPPPPPPPPPAPEPKADGWQFQGEAYDLITLKPIAGVAMQFRILGGANSAATTTDAKGRFKITLPALGGGGSYDLTVSHKDYLDGFVDETDPPLKDSDLEDRRIQAGAAQGNARWLGKAKAVTKRDIILIPKVMPKDL